MNLLKMCGPQIRLCLFTFRPIALKQLNSLTTINTLSWLKKAHYLPQNFAIPFAMLIYLVYSTYFKSFDRL